MEGPLLGGSRERVAAFVCVPWEAETPGPAVFCHHQHAGKFALGKSEVVGLEGDPDQAYASELAEQGFITIAPDAVGFGERNWSPDRSENISWFELLAWSAGRHCLPLAFTTSPSPSTNCFQVPTMRPAARCLSC